MFVLRKLELTEETRDTKSHKNLQEALSRGSSLEYAIW